MTQLVGFLGIAFSLTFYTGWAYKLKWISYPLLIGVSLRIGFVLFDYFVMKLPDHGSDALNFHLQAIAWSQNGFLEMLQSFPGPTTYFYAWLLAFFYSVFEPSVLLAQSISVFLGGGIILLGAHLAQMVAGRRAAIISAWLTALFPTLVLYSSIPLREPFVVFFFLMALYGSVVWYKYNRVVGVWISILGFALATFFHGAFALGALGFLGMLVLRSLKRAVSGWQVNSLKSASITISILAPIAIAVLIAGGVAIPKLGSVISALDADKIISIVNYSARDGAAYPAWTQPNTPAELIFKSPVRLIYFLFSPFPWDVSRPQHLIGLLDGLFYLGVFLYLIKNHRALPAESKFLLLVAFPVVLAFALAIGNFGTGVRHRAKFISLFLVILSSVRSKSKPVKNRIYGSVNRAE